MEIIKESGRYVQSRGLLSKSKILIMASEPTVSKQAGYHALVGCKNEASI